MRMESTSVVVVGGGLAGLSAAVFLSWRGVSTVVVERHLGSSPHPRAVGFRPRTMELYRAVGLESIIPPAPPGARPRRIRAESLAGQWFEELHWSPDSSAPPVEFSPCPAAKLAQDGLEPLLRDKAADLGADLRLGTELMSFEQDGDNVRAVLRPTNGAEYAVRADYLVAADGHHSPVREALGVQRSGRGYLRTVRSVLFRAPLEDYLHEDIAQFQIDQPGFSGFLATYGDGRWLLIMPDDTERDEDTLRAVVIRAIGRSDLPVEIITTGRWEISAAIAEKYAHGRVFLAGDAAHSLPPNRGGYGANVGIEDTHNLAWKLATVLSGDSVPELLDSYDAERRPVAWLCHDQLFARADGHDPTGPNEDVSIIDDAAMDFGQLYRSSAVLGATGELPPAARPDEWAGQPGTRAPHLWLTRNDARLTTLDLLQRGWVLFTEDDRWCTAAEQATERSGIAVECHRIGERLQPEEPDEFRRAFGLSQDGATLVRPDGYIAWRSPGLPVQPADTLTEALGRVSFAPRHVAVSRPA